MSLTFKRNLPLILLLVSIVSFLMLAVGNQPIISYSIQLVLGT